MAAPYRADKEKKRYDKMPRGWPCKPCWELKYCPYGPIVEFFPIIFTDKLRWPKNEVMTWVGKAHSNLLSKCDPFDISCNIFGHVCPVFVMAENATETREERYSGRHVPRDIMLKVVRRDNYLCQICHQQVPDNEIELDHIIPVAKGGPTRPENLRLLCRKCNREKADSIRMILNEFALQNSKPLKKSSRRR